LRQSHTLPPRSGNAVAAVAGAPNANLLVLTHNGFCADCRARPWWQLLVHRQLLVRTVVVPLLRCHRRRTGTLVGSDLDSGRYPGRRARRAAVYVVSGAEVSA
jgi:hypothetical protein